jgi:hypothetical protein|tara:strand:- start:194 stop:523 length:330 start_codon:yes stop_codon:yes gene_type:complete
MAKISSFPQDTTVEAGDKLLGTDVSGATKNFSITSIVNSTPFASHGGTTTHTQGSASSTWTVTHNLNKFPSVTIVDSNEEQIFGVVDYQSANTIVLTFSAAISGKAYLN